LNDPIAVHRRVWQEKAVLRAVYTDLYERIAFACTSHGPTLEIGGGSGNFKEFRSDALSCDVTFQPWLDFVADAQSLPIATASLGNIVLFDVLHHIEYPALFFREAERVLRPSGRLVMVEPAITPLSSPFYRLVHAEPVQMSADPLRVGTPSRQRRPFESNQALPTLVVGRHRKRFDAMFPHLKVQSVNWLSLFAYPLSGGFQRWSAIPANFVKPLLRIENVLAPSIGRLLAFRMMIVVERR
jgi:SAM-dependent methyltransferase